MERKIKELAHVYIFYDKEGCVLYVGITQNYDYRFKQHFKSKLWFDDIHKIKISESMNRNQTSIYEIYYISILKPKYNDDYNRIDCSGFDLKL